MGNSYQDWIKELNLSLAIALLSYEIACKQAERKVIEEINKHLLQYPELDSLYNKLRREGETWNMIAIKLHAATQELEHGLRIE